MVHGIYSAEVEVKQSSVLQLGLKGRGVWLNKKVT